MFKLKYLLLFLSAALPSSEVGAFTVLVANVTPARGGPMAQATLVPGGKGAFAAGLMSSEQKLEEWARRSAGGGATSASQSRDQLGLTILINQNPPAVAAIGVTRGRGGSGKSKREKIAGVGLSILSRLPKVGESKNLIVTKSFAVVQATLRLPDLRHLQVLAVRMPLRSRDVVAHDLALDQLEKIRMGLPKDDLVLAAGDFGVSRAVEVEQRFVERLLQPKWLVAHLLGCRVLEGGGACRGTVLDDIGDSAEPRGGVGGKQRRGDRAIASEDGATASDKLDSALVDPKRSSQSAQVTDGATAGYSRDESFREMVLLDKDFYDGRKGWKVARDQVRTLRPANPADGEHWPLLLNLEPVK